MRFFSILLCIVTLSLAGSRSKSAAPLRLHFAGWTSVHPDLVNIADERTREELNRSEKLSVLPRDSVAVLRMRWSSLDSVPTPEEAPAVARAVHRPVVVWAHLSSFEYEVSHPFWRPFWAVHVWRAEADFFLYDSVRKTVKRSSARLRTSFSLGFTGLAGASKLPASDGERARASEELLRALSVKLRKAAEEMPDD